MARPDGIDFARHWAAASMLGWTPQTFWASTPWELYAAIRARGEANVRACKINGERPTLAQIMADMEERRAAAEPTVRSIRKKGAKLSAASHLSGKVSHLSRRPPLPR